MPEKRRKGAAWSADDASVWERLAQTVKPLKPGPRSRPAAPPPPRPVAWDAVGDDAVGKTESVPERSAPALARADPKTLRRLRRGELGIEATLDLHRQTLDQAHRALGRFIDGAFESGRRTVLVITGRGLGPDGATGAIRSAVPRWLDEPGLRERILASAPALPRDGGAGALYLLIRRKR